MSSEQLLFMGMALMGIAAVAGIIAAIVLRISSKRLMAQLEEEFGSKRH